MRPTFFQNKTFVLGFFTLMCSVALHGQSNSRNFNNVGLGGTGFFAVNDFDVDSIDASGFGLGLNLSYYPVDFDAFGVGLHVEPTFLWSLDDLRIPNVRAGASVRLLGRNTDVLPIGLELHFGRQRHWVQEAFLETSLFKLGSYYQAVVIQLPVDDGGVFFFRLNHFRQGSNSGLDFMVGINVVFDDLL